MGEAKALAMDASFDWDSLAKIALADGLAPLLYRQLNSQDWAPEPFQVLLRNANLYNASTNSVLFFELEKLLNELEEDKIPCVLLKGAALAGTIYANIALRPMVDIDLLVHPHDLPKIQQILINDGYQSFKTELRGEAALQFDNETVLFKTGMRTIPVELHWSLFNSPYYQAKIAMEWFWQTSLPAASNGSPSRILGPEAQLLHLCGHLWLQHSGNELLWMHDMVEWIFHYQDEIDWSELLGRAKDCLLIVPFKQIMPVMREEFGAPIPDDFLDSLEAIEPSTIEIDTIQQIKGMDRGAGQRFWDDLRAIPRYGDKFIFAWQKIFPSWEYMRQRYQVSHPALLPLYYIYRLYLGLRTSR